MYFLLEKRILGTAAWSHEGIVVADTPDDAVEKTGLREISRKEDEEPFGVYVQLVDKKGNDYFLDSIEEITSPIPVN